jgi:hypothetical protein
MSAPDLTPKAEQDLAYLRELLGPRCSGPFLESDGSWAVTLVRRVPLPGSTLVDERREHHLGATAEIALGRARAEVEAAIAAARSRP